MMGFVFVSSRQRRCDRVPGQSRRRSGCDGRQGSNSSFRRRRQPALGERQGPARSRSRPQRQRQEHVSTLLYYIKSLVFF